MVKDNRGGRFVLAMCGWLALALLAAPFAYAAERGVVLVLDAQGEQAKSATARTALVIGNSSYPGSRLRNPVNDATDVAEGLQGLGFEVVLSLDVDKRVLVKAMRKFRQRLQRRGGVGLFYYAGHGIQVRGRNYLIPVGADIETEADVEYAAVDAGLVLRYMEEADARLNIVILDACRNNPVARSWRAETRGLVRLELPQGPLGSLLAYSTAPGKVAADGTGRNSPFTKHLLLNLAIAGLDLEDVFKKTRIGVKRDTDGKQIPWSESSLVGDFYFQHSTLIDDGPQVFSAILPPKRVHEKASLTIRSNVYEDRVYIDGQEMGSTRLDVDLAPGKHTVRVEKEGYVPYEETVELKLGQEPVMRAILSKASVPETPNTAMAPVRRSSGGLEISANVHNATVYVDGHNAGTASPDKPLLLRQLAPGAKTVEVSAPGYQSKREQVSVIAEEWTRVVVKLPPKRSDDLLAVGVYYVVQGSGFDEPLLGGTITSDRNPGENHGTLEVTLRTQSGQYVYRVRTRVEGDYLHGTIFETNDAEYLGHSYKVNVTRMGNQYLWVDNAGRRMTLERQ